MESQPKPGGRRINKPTYVTFDTSLFIYLLAQFHIRIVRCFFLFPTYVQLCTKTILPFLDTFQQTTFLADLKHLSHIIISRLLAFSQVTNN